MVRNKGNKIVENLDKPILAFSGMIAGKAAMKVLDKALTNLNPNIADFTKATILTTASLLGHQKAVEGGSDNAQFFFVGMATAGVGKAVEVISGGQLDGIIDSAMNGLGLGSQPATADPIADIYGEDYNVDTDADDVNMEDEGVYLPELPDNVNLPVMNTDVVFTERAEVSGTTNDVDEEENVEDVTYEDVQDVDYEDVYEID